MYHSVEISISQPNTYEVLETLYLEFNRIQLMQFLN